MPLFHRVSRGLWSWAIDAIHATIDAMHATRDELVLKIKAVSHPTRSTTLVAIDGCGGSGKSTLATALAVSLENAYVVHGDDLAANPAHPEWRQRLMMQVVNPLLNERPARYARFEWRNGEIAGWNDIDPGGVVIVVGISTLHSDLGDPWDVAIWVDCPRELRLARGIDRDGEAMRSTWIDKWMPEEDEYIAVEMPHARAHFIYNGAGDAS